MKPLTTELKQQLAAAIADAKQFSRPPAFQFYVNDWLGSASIAAMNATQEGGYTRLLALCWATDDLSIPKDPAKLAAMSRLNSQWQEFGAAILDCFSPHLEPDKLTHRRLIQERFKQMEYRRGQKDRADKRWSSICRADAAAMPPQCPRKADPMLSPLSFVLCPLSDCPLHSLEEARPASPPARESKSKISPEHQKAIGDAYAAAYSEVHHVAYVFGGARDFNGLKTVLNRLGYAKTPDAAVATVRERIGLALNLDRAARKLDYPDKFDLFPETLGLFCSSQRFNRLTLQQIATVKTRVEAIAEAKRNKARATGEPVPTRRSPQIVEKFK